MYNIDGLLSNVDLVELAERAGSEMHKVGPRWSGACPLHGGDNKTAFSVYEIAGRQKWHCFSHDCGTGDAIDFVMKWRNIDFTEACEYLGGDNKATPEEILEAARKREERERISLAEQQKIYDQALANLRAAENWVRYHDELQHNLKARELWRAKGVPDSFQNYWHLGFRQIHKYKSSKGEWFESASMTIPIFGDDMELLNIRHRLVNPLDPKDKYRPEMPDLPAVPFVSDLDTGYHFERAIVVEGEIKAAVVWLTLDSDKWQVIGIPGKNSFYKTGLIEKLKDKNVVICFDPDAKSNALKAAEEVSGKMLHLPMKIDDAITSGTIDRNGLRRLIFNSLR